MTVFLLALGCAMNVAFSAPAVLWTRSAGSNWGRDSASDLAIYDNRLLYLAGDREILADSSFWVAQLSCWDTAGTLQWSRFLPEMGHHGGYWAMELGPDSSLYVVTDSAHWAIRKLSITGDSIYSVAWQGPPDYPSRPLCLLPESDGSCWIAGATDEYPTPVISHYSAEGDTLLTSLWTYPGCCITPLALFHSDTAFYMFGNQLGCNGAMWCEAFIPPDWFEWSWYRCMPYVSVDAAVARLTDGSLAFAGSIHHSYPPWGDGPPDGLVTRTDEYGSLMWARALGDSLGEGFVDVIESSDGNIVACGNRPFRNDQGVERIGFWLVKFDLSGAVLWDTTYSFNNSAVQYCVGCAQLGDGSFVIGGSGSVRPGFHNDMILMRTTPDEPQSASPRIEHLPTEFSLDQNFPNPFNASTAIRFDLKQRADVELVVHDLLGREIQTLVNSQLTPGQYTYYFHGQDLASGVYFFRLTAGATTQTRKMLLLK